jgi:hypothetical protein
MTDINKIVSHVVDIPGKKEVLVTYTDGTSMKFYTKEWEQVISKGREAYTFLCATEDYKNLLEHD